MGNNIGVAKTKAELEQALGLLREVLQQNAPIKESCDAAGKQLDAISSGSRRSQASEAITMLGIAARGTETVTEQVEAAIELIEKYMNSL